MNKITAKLMALFTFAMVSQNVFAGNEAGAFSLNIGAGELFFASKRNMENTTVPFFIFGYDFTDTFGFEAFLGGYNTEYKSSPPNNHPNKGINGTMFLVDGVYRFAPFPRTTIEPYFLAGVGVIGMNPNGNDAHNEGNVNAAIGAQIFASKIVAFRLEARDLYTWVGGKNDIMLNAGVTFLINSCCAR